MCGPHCGGGLRPLRFHAAPPLGQRDLLVAISITVARHLLATFAQMAASEVETTDKCFNFLLNSNYLAPVTKSRKIFHSLRSQNLLLFLSRNTKLSVAMRSSSDFQLAKSLLQ